MRKARGLSQESLGDVSSRTYVSALERALKSPTLGKIDELSAALRVHPLTLVALCYLTHPPSGLDELLKTVEGEVSALFE